MLTRIIKTTIKEGGTPLLEYVASRYTYHARSLWQELIDEGRLLLNGHISSAEQILQLGDELEYMPRPIREPDVDANVEVLLADERYIALNKSGNLPCHPSGIFFNNTLWAMLKEGRISGIAPMGEVHFVNRLDRETSGIVLVGRTSADAASAVRQLKEPSSIKEYRVCVFGDFPDYMDAKGWLFHEASAIVSKRRSFSFERPSCPSENCHTTFSCLKRENGYSLLNAVLHTGRTHQIRATLQSLGFPLLGDKIYGPDETIFLRFLQDAMTENDRIALRFKRQALHAWHLRFGQYDIYTPSCDFE